MIGVTVKDIARASGGELTSGGEGETVKGFSIDSRTIQPGEFFIAVKGENFDGHDFLDDAVKKGAAGLIVGKNTGLAGQVRHLLRVKDTREAMGLIAAEIRKRVNIPVICITGTSGKTTLKDMLADILSSEYKVLKNRRSYNNVIGLSLTLFDLEPTHEIAVLEIGTNRPGEIERLGKIAKPSVAVITNIGYGHLEFLQDLEGVRKEKLSLLRCLSDDGVAYLNKDDELLEGSGTGGIKTRYFGRSPGSDFLISDLERNGKGYSFFLGEEEFFIPLEGEHNVYNAAAAIAVSSQFGVSMDKARSRMHDMLLPDMRLERVNVGGVIFINDSYNANPCSFECALKVLADSPEKGKKGVVAGGMFELGAGAARFHKMIGESIAEKNIDFLITVGKKASDIAGGAIEKGMQKSSVYNAESHEDAAGILQRIAHPDDVILIKGSRNSKMEEVLKCFTTSYIR